MKEGKRFHEFEIGEKFTTAGRTVTETDIINFVGVSGLFEDLFLDTEYIRNETSFKQRIAPGSMTFSLAEGLATQTGILHHTGLAFLGATLRVLAPTRCNDTIHVEIEVTEKRLTTDPSRGVVTFLQTVRNQDGQAVLSYNVTRMIKT